MSSGDSWRGSLSVSPYSNESPPRATPTQIDATTTTPKTSASTSRTVASLYPITTAREDDGGLMEHPYR
jgi:hypothetical protein